MSGEEIEFPKATRRTFVRGTLLSPLLSLGRFLLVGKTAASRTVAQNESSSRQTHIVVDATVPKFFPPVGLQVLEKYIDDLLVGSVNCCVATVAWIEDLQGTMNRIQAFAPVFVRFQDKIIHAGSVADIERARRTGKVAIVFQFQGSGMIGNDLGRVALFHSLGVRIIQLTYNWKFLAGDGCLERTDCGLTDLGVALVQEMNRLGIVVDCSHTGYKTSMDAIQLSRHPVMFSHSNAWAIYPSLRNIRDEQIRAVAKKGGVVGVNSYIGFLSENTSGLPKMIDHIDYMVRLVGPEHVGIGTDFVSQVFDQAMDPLVREHVVFQRVMDTDRYRQTYRQIPYQHPPEFSSHAQMPKIAQALKDRGYSAADIDKIMGENMMRIFRAVWRAG